MKELIEAGVEKGKAELAAQIYRVVMKDKTYHGEIHLGITFTLKVCITVLGMHFGLLLIT